MAFEFVKELGEARLYRKPSNIPSVSIGTIGENLFNAALALHIMKYENPKAAAVYAKRTLATGLDNWRSSGSDFNNMVQILVNQYLVQMPHQDLHSSPLPRGFDREISSPQWTCQGCHQDIWSQVHTYQAQDCE